MCTTVHNDIIIIVVRARLTMWLIDSFRIGTKKKYYISRATKNVYIAQYMYIYRKMKNHNLTILHVLSILRAETSPTSIAWCVLWICEFSDTTLAFHMWQYDTRVYIEQSAHRGHCVDLCAHCVSHIPTFSHLSFFGSSLLATCNTKVRTNHLTHAKRFVIIFSFHFHSFFYYFVLSYFSSVHSPAVCNWL